MSSPAASSATATPARRHNLSRLLTLVHREGPRSRAALTRRIGLNRSTIAGLVSELVALGLVSETETHRLHRGGTAESAGDGRGIRGRAHGQSGHRRGHGRSGRSRRGRAQADPLSRRGGSDGDRGGQPGRGAGGRDAFGAGQPVPGAGGRRGGAGSGRAVDRDGDSGAAPGLARRAAGRTDHDGHRLPVWGVERRPGRPGGRAVVRRGSGPGRPRLSQRQRQRDRRRRGQRGPAAARPTRVRRRARPHRGQPFRGALPLRAYGLSGDRGDPGRAAGRARPARRGGGVVGGRAAGRGRGREHPR